MVSTNGKLFFEESLISKQRTIPAGDLLKRLKSLNEKLKELRQEEVDTSSCNDVAMELITPTLIHHRDNGVRALVACCLCEILRIFAPTAPYNSDQLKNIFSLLAREIQGLGQIHNTYYLFHVQHFSSLAMVRSISLITELENADDLVMEFFHAILTHITSEHPSSIQQNAIDIMSTLIDESTSLPMELTELLLNHIAGSSNTVSHTMAVQVAQSNSVQLQKYVCQYFVDTLLEAAKATHQQHISPDQLANLKSSHLLLTKVYQHVPSLLSNVIPHLEEEMVTENSHFRLLAIQTIGTMLTQRHDFHKHFPQTWKSWLNRRNDKVLELRLLWLSFIPSIYNVHANTVSLDLNPCLEQKLIDVDDHVRYAACECISKIQFDVIKSCMTRSFLDALGSRIKDKSFKVRFQAINTIGQLWKQLMRVLLPSSEDNENDPSLKRPTYRCPLEEEEVQEWLALFGGLPSSILASAYLNANDLTAILENTLIDQVVHPKEVKSDDWKLQILRLLWFLSCVREDPRALQAMYSVLQRQFITIQELRLFFQLILEKASISTEEEKNAWTHRMQCLLQLMVSRLPDPQNSAYETLLKVSELPKEQWMPQFEKFMNWKEHEFRSMRKAGKKVLDYFESTVPGSLQVLGVLARRASPAIVCKERITPLIQIVKTPSTGYQAALRDAGFWLLKSVSKLFPTLLEDELPAILELTEMEPDLGLPILSQLSEVELPNSFVKQINQWLIDPEYTLMTSRTLARSKNLAFKKFLPSMLTQVKKQDDKASLLVAITFFAQLASYQQSSFAEHSEAVVSIILRMFNPEKFPFQSKETSPWISETNIPIESKLQIMGFKLLKHHAIHTDPEIILSLISQILKAKSTFFFSWPPFASSLLRLYASKALLRLASSGLDHNIPTSCYLLLLNVVQDTVPELREGVLMKIKAGLQKQTLPLRYLPMFCYSVLQPNTTLKASFSAFLKSQNNVIMEIPRMLFVFAHQGTLETWTSLLSAIFPFILNVNQIGLAYHLCTLIKAHQVNSQAPKINEHVYMLADLAEQKIRELSKVHNWPLTNPVDAQLPSELFTPLPSEEAFLNATRIYLPENFPKKRTAPSGAEDIPSKKKLTHYELELKENQSSSF